MKKQSLIQTILTVLLVIAAFAVGSLWTELRQLKSAAGSGSPAGTQAPSQAAGEGEIVKVSVDDDPVLGDQSAPITLIEFSDYECPFCKRHFDQTLGQLKEKYLDTGKLKLVYRDLPLSFHDPMATKEAVAANCAREQTGDQGYFAFHDQIFTRTTSNGDGLNDQDLQTIAGAVGLNLNDFNTCLTSQAPADEVKKDLADAQAAGADGTPTFFIGKSTADGVIDGERVVGALPFSALETIIDKYLE